MNGVPEFEGEQRRHILSKQAITRLDLVGNMLRTRFCLKEHYTFVPDHGNLRGPLP